MKPIANIIFFLLISELGFTQHNEHNHSHEVGFASSPVYFVNKKEWSYGIHLHYVYLLNQSRFGLGLGYEQIFDAHEHHTLGLIGNFNPFKGMSINLSTGITYESKISDGIKPAFHLETSYGFELGHFHIGPVTEAAFDLEDYHFSLGLHIGYGFL